MVLLQDAVRDPEWLYQRVRCPLFRRIESRLAADLIQRRINEGAWTLVQVGVGKHICHTTAGKEIPLGRREDGPRLCILVEGLLAVQAGAHSGGRNATLLAQFVRPGELARHFGVAAQLGRCPYPKDELAAVYALSDSWVLTVPHREFFDFEGRSEADKRHSLAMALGLMGSLYDALSTNRMIERRLAGAGPRVRFVATMLAVVARHGEVDATDPEPSNWPVWTRFEAPSQFFKGLARLREGDSKWRGSLQLDGVLEIPDATRGQVKLWPNRLVLPSVWDKFESEVQALPQLCTEGEKALGFRSACRDMAYAAYRVADRPGKERLDRYFLEDDCLSAWESFLASVLPKEDKSKSPSGHWLG